MVRARLTQTPTQWWNSPNCSVAAVGCVYALRTRHAEVIIRLLIQGIMLILDWKILTAGNRIKISHASCTIKTNTEIPYGEIVVIFANW